MSTNTILATTPLVSTNYLLRATGTTIGNSLIWDNGTNVGIGNTSPSYTLDVSGTGRFTSDLTSLTIKSTYSGTTNWNSFGNQLFIGVNGANNNYLSDNMYYNGAWLFANAGAGAQIYFGASAAGSIDFRTAPTGAAGGTPTITNRMTILQGGNVGIGTSSPLYNLHVAKSTSENAFIGVGQGTANGDRQLRIGFGGNGSHTYASLQGTRYNTADDVNIVMQAGGGNVGIGTSSPGYKLVVNSGTDGVSAGIAGSTYGIRFDNGGTFSSGMSTIHGVDSTLTGSYQPIMINGSDVRFGTSATERMRITSGGDVFVGFSGSAAGQRLRVQGADSGSVNYSLVVANSTTASTFLVRNDGAVQVVGSLSKGSGSFRIDHPLESMTKTHQLVHSFIEGPRVDLIYRGKLTLVNGKAEANIDEISTMTIGTFEALCREVQCFTTNESGWDLVKGKVIGNIIYIESQNTNSTDEISWMVIGERKDKHIIDTDWTDENGKVIVEPLKTNLPTIQNLQEQINILAK